MCDVSYEAARAAAPVLRTLFRINLLATRRSGLPAAGRGWLGFGFGFGLELGIGIGIGLGIGLGLG